MQCQCGGVFLPICDKCEKQGWVDVRDALPERGLFLTTDGTSYEICMFVGLKFIPKSCKTNQFNVTHWMPLPFFPDAT